jgi:broad specificity phosphatase PhoE
MTTRLILVRHGQTVANAEGRFISKTDPGLDPVGSRQVQRLSQALGSVAIGVVMSSPRRRCLETMEGIEAAQAGRPECQVDDRLTELGMGAFEGLSRVDIARAGMGETFDRWRQGDPPAYPPGAERFEEAAARALPLFHEAARLDAETVVIVSHSHLLRILIAVGVLRGGAEMHRRLYLGHGTYTVIEWELGEPRLKTLNGMP